MKAIKRKPLDARRLATSSFFNAIMGFIFAFFSPWLALAILLLGMLNALNSKLLSNKIKQYNTLWLVPMLLNLTILAGVVLFITEGKSSEHVKARWYPAVSKNEYYMGSLPYIRQTNFNFDSLKISNEELKDIELATVDTSAAPPDAPPEE